MSDKASKENPAIVTIAADISRLNETQRSKIKSELLKAISAEVSAGGVSPAFSRVTFDKWEN